MIILKISEEKVEQANVEEVEIHEFERECFDKIQERKKVLKEFRKDILTCVNEDLIDFGPTCPICSLTLSMTQDDGGYYIKCDQPTTNHSTVIQKNKYPTPHEALKYLEIDDFRIR
jgi:hypothetical protein